MPQSSSKPRTSTIKWINEGDPFHPCQSFLHTGTAQSNQEKVSSLQLLPWETLYRMYITHSSLFGSHQKDWVLSFPAQSTDRELAYFKCLGDAENKKCTGVTFHSPAQRPCQLEQEMPSIWRKGGKKKKTTWQISLIGKLQTNPEKIHLNKMVEKLSESQDKMVGKVVCLYEDSL